MSRQILVWENITTKALLAYVLHLGLGPDWVRKSWHLQFNAEDCKQKSVFAINDAHADPGHDADAADVLHFLLMEGSTIGAGLIYWEAYL